jgi:hypothetical protein
LQHKLQIETNDRFGQASEGSIMTNVVRSASLAVALAAQFLFVAIIVGA